MSDKSGVPAGETIPEIDRWKFFPPSILPSGMCPRENGDWVKYSDHVRVCDQLSRNWQLRLAAPTSVPAETLSIPRMPNARIPETSGEKLGRIPVAARETMTAHEFRFQNTPRIEQELFEQLGRGPYRWQVIEATMDAYANYRGKEKEDDETNPTKL